MFVGIRSRFAGVAAVAPRAFWYVWWGTLINRLGGFVVPLLTIYLIKVRGLEVGAAGGVISVYGAGAIVASLVGGYLTDRIGRKVTLVASLFGGALALIGLGVARDLPAITAMVGVVAFVSELYRPAVFAFVADVVPPTHRTQAYGLLYWAINLGFAFASIVGGLLADLDFSILFFADAATMAIYGLLVVIAVPETRPPRAAHATQPAAHRPARSWITDRTYVAFLVILLGFAVLGNQAAAPLAAHMTAQGFSSAAFGAVMAVNGVLIILLQPMLSTWCVRHDPTRVLIGAMLLFGTGLLLHGLAPDLALHMVAGMVWTLGEILESPTRSNIIAAMAPADARGRYQGAAAMIFGVAQLIGPRGGTWLWQHAGPNVLWTSCLGLSVIVAIGLALTGPARRRRMAHM